MGVRKERFLGWDALVLAGGASRRMGRDKASLRVEGMPLLELQLRRARAAGAGGLWVACGVGGPTCEAVVEGVRWLTDPAPDCGPWPGLVSALRASGAGLLMVLAVDLPALTPGFLGRLIEAAGPGMGCVPESRHGIEPLCAAYPVAEALREARGDRGRRRSVAARLGPARNRGGMDARAALVSRRRAMPGELESTRGLGTRDGRACEPPVLDGTALLRSALGRKRPRHHGPPDGTVRAKNLAWLYAPKGLAKRASMGFPWPSRVT